MGCVGVWEAGRVCMWGAAVRPHRTSPHTTVHPAPSLQFQCYCEKTWYGTVRCRIFDAQDFPLPVTWWAGVGWLPVGWLARDGQQLGAELMQHLDHAPWQGVLLRSCCTAAPPTTSSSPTTSWRLPRAWARRWTSGSLSSWSTPAHRRKSGCVLPPAACGHSSC